MKTEALKIFEDIMAKKMFKFDETHKPIDSRNSVNPKQYQHTYTTHTKVSRNQIAHQWDKILKVTRGER